jgi:hypothetical protein
MKLATVQKIIDIKEIPGSDFIELAFVLGWQIIIKKGEYKIGDLCCYIEIDTITPVTSEFQFLEKYNYRVKTQKMRGVLSQGLIIPLPPGKWKEEDDLTDIIGIKKYEKPDNNPVERYEKPRVPKIWYKKLWYLFKYTIFYKMFPEARPKLRSPFPTHLVSITDEERIQNCPQILEKYRWKEFIVSYKLDGSSLTIIHNKVFGISKFRICSRRFELHDKKNDWYKVFESTNFKKHILNLVEYYNTNDIIVQGEAIGKFNGNYHQLAQEEIRLFNIYVDGKRINQERFYLVCDDLLKIPCCPFYKRVVLNHSMEEILQESNIKDILNPKVPVEGLVWRSIEDNTSFKVINNNYLLKYE